jgi:hypothetical protein
MAGSACFFSAMRGVLSSEGAVAAVLSVTAGKGMFGAEMKKAANS